MNEVKERPILFKPEMVRETRADRKTQTRRMRRLKRVNENPGAWKVDVVLPGGLAVFNRGNGCEILKIQCPYGAPGDLLYVRETWGFGGMSSWFGGGKPSGQAASVTYHADGERRKIPFHTCEEMYAATPKQNLKLPVNFNDLGIDEQRCLESDALDAWWKRQQKKPSIYMPKWAARLWLRVTGVRVERVQDITEADAKAEGCEDSGGLVSGPMDPPEYDGCPASWEFGALWDSINAKRGYGWDTNPWVWVVSYEKEKHDANTVHD